MHKKIPDQIIERGRIYAAAGNVVSVSENVKDRAWYAKVIGQKAYHVKIDGSGKYKDVCTCPYWAEHGYCKHTVAVETYLGMHGKKRLIQDENSPSEAAKASESIYEKEKYTGNRRDSFFKYFEKPHLGGMLIDQMGKARESSAVKLLADTMLQVEVQLGMFVRNPFHLEKSTLVISLKIGEVGGRKYIVKEIEKFFDKYIKEEKYWATTSKGLALGRHCFDKKTQELLDYLYELHISDSLFKESISPIKAKDLKRYIIISAINLAPTLDLLNDFEYFSYSLFDIEGKNLKLEYNEQPLDFKIVKLNQGASLINTSEQHIYFEHYHCLFIQDKFILLKPNQVSIYHNLAAVEQQATMEKIDFTEEDLPELFSKVIPSLKEIGKVWIAPEFEHQTLFSVLEPILRFYLVGNQIEVTVMFCYGPVVFSDDPQLEKNKHRESQVIRNLELEQQIKVMIHHYNYFDHTTYYAKNLPKKQELYHFFTVELKTFRRIAKVEVDSTLQSLFLDASKYQPQITIEERGSWLDIHFDISSIESDEIQAILKSLDNQESFHQLKDGSILDFESEEFVKTSKVLVDLREKITYQGDGFKVPTYRGMEIQEHFSDFTHADFSREFEEMVQYLTNPQNYPEELPKGIQANLRQYQETGFKWLHMLNHYHFGGILADDMGLGKTLQMIAFLLSEKEAKRMENPALVVAPASLIYNWQMECEKFAPDLKVEVISGAKNERQQKIQQDEAPDIMITSYSSFRQDAQLYDKSSFQYLILDEAQMVKNSATKTFQALKNMNIEQRFALSGTPIENKLEELWALFQILMPGLFPSKLKFNKMSAKTVGMMIRPFILRREKSLVLQDLPDKIETNLYSDLSEEQKRIYVAHLQKIQQAVNQMDQADFAKNRMTILAGLTRLRQICCDPRLFLEDFEGESGKLEQLKELVVSARETGRRILIFSQFTSMLSIIQLELSELGLDSFYLRGSTPPKERIEMVEAFNYGEKDIFLISLKAGGTGLNLTGADTVILYDLWWNPAVEEQAASRAHRMGQKKVVEVWRLITKGTIEEKIDRLQQEKKELFQKVMSDEEGTSLQQMTEEDIRQILSAGLES